MGGRRDIRQRYDAAASRRRRRHALRTSSPPTLVYSRATRRIAKRARTDVHAAHTARPLCARQSVAIESESRPIETENAHTEGSQRAKTLLTPRRTTLDTYTRNIHNAQYLNGPTRTRPAHIILDGRYAPSSDVRAAKSPHNHYIEWRTV